MPAIMGVPCYQQPRGKIHRDWVRLETGGSRAYRVKGSLGKQKALLDPEKQNAKCSYFMTEKL